MTDTFADIDHVTISGPDQKEHDDNLERFFEAAKRKNLTHNNEKLTFSTHSLHILNHNVDDRKIQSNPKKLKSLRELPTPTDSKSQK